MSANPSSGGTQSSQTSSSSDHEAPSSSSTAAAASTPHPPQPFVRPPPSQTFDPAAEFMEAYDCAKLNNDWNKVSSSLMIHPDWLTRIPSSQ